MNFGHIIAVASSNIHDIINRRNSPCGHINNVLSYFGGLGIVAKLNLLRSYCSSFYGGKLCDFTNDGVVDFCVP